MLAGSLPFSLAVLEDRVKTVRNPKTVSVCLTSFDTYSLSTLRTLNDHPEEAVRLMGLVIEKNFLHLIIVAVKSRDITNTFLVEEKKNSTQYKYICISHLY